MKSPSPVKARNQPSVLYKTFAGRECCVSASGKMFFRNKRLYTLGLLASAKEKGKKL